MAHVHGGGHHAPGRGRRVGEQFYYVDCSDYYGANPGLVPAECLPPNGLLYSQGVSGVPGSLAWTPPTVNIPGVGFVSAPAPNPQTYKRVPVPDGPGGTLATMQTVGALALEAAADPQVVAEARSIVRACPPRADACALSAILDYVKTRCDYRSDPIAEDASGTELDHISSPGYLLFVDGGEDCESLMGLVAALVLAAGVAGIMFRAVALDPARPTQMSHVYAMALLKDGRQLAMDPVPPDAKLGDQPPQNIWLAPPIDYVVAQV
jgi:hypothetical protein